MPDPTAYPCPHCPTISYNKRKHNHHVRFCIETGAAAANPGEGKLQSKNIYWKNTVSQLITSALLHLFR
jgi:hypothetical protein